jgi:hypothetical protein
MPLHSPTLDSSGLDFGEGLGVYTPGKVQEFLHGPDVPGVNPVTYDWAGYNQGAQSQRHLQEMLLARAQGRGGPSVAEQQLALTTDANRRAAMGQAASARGGAMQQQAAARQAQAQGVQVQQQAAGQAALMRAQEQQAAMGQYQQALNAQQQAELQRQLQMGSTQVGLTTAENQRVGQQREQDASGLASMVGGIGAIASKLSDERAKTNIAPADSEIEDFLGHLAAKRYQYKEGTGEPPGMHTGVMAQDMERSPVGREFVREGPDGMKWVDTGRMPLMLLAALAEQQKRLDSLEQKKGGRHG